VPDLSVTGLRSCALYADAWTNDARLTLENVQGAVSAGAVVLNRAEVVALRLTGGRVAGAEVAVDGGRVSVEARAVVNATGPWVDRVRRLESESAGSSVRLSKGVHAVVPGGSGWSAALTVPQDDVRVTFAVPWYDALLLGTTDTEYDGDPAAVAVDEADVAQILAEARIALAGVSLEPASVRATFAGLRVLPAGPGQSVSARRETVYSIGPGGMLSVAGGKLTTYRRIALDALERLRPVLGVGRVDRRPWPLPGAARTSAALPAGLDPAVRAHVTHLYGGYAADVLAPAAEDPTLLERIHPDGPDVLAQAVWAARREWAGTVDDVLRRRTTVALRGLADDRARERVERVLAEASGSG
jgi:glycerol-3-phosphate dehydrogenase